MKSLFWVWMFLFALPLVASAQKSFSQAIEDNSFLIEEAYNQEPRVVQHISNGLYSSGTGESFVYAFTQEWPVFSQKHQFSYSIPIAFLVDADQTGVGDIFVNYRYQLTGHDSFLTMAPRFSVILPTGDEEKGTGTGSAGFQFNLPMSKRLADPWVVHFNAGFTVLPDVQGENFTSYFGGGSLIWLATPTFNVMLEYLLSVDAQFGDPGIVDHESSNILNPGLRFAINHGDLQVVPGVSVPLTVYNGDVQAGVFLYLSFEHPF